MGLLPFDPLYPENDFFAHYIPLQYINLYHADLLHVEISAEVCTCSTSNCALHRKSQQRILIETHFILFNMLSVADYYTGNTGTAFCFECVMCVIHETT